jgi:TRAP-type uncharacterized transport system fused permease subunit
MDYGHLLLPIGALVYFLADHRTAYYAATMSTISVLAISFLRAGTRLTVAKFLEGLRNSVWRMVSIATTLFCAGVAVAVLQTTGVPFKFSSFIVQLAQGNLLVTLMLVAVTTIILGMGLPVSGAFLIAALFGAPAMITLGVDPFVSYMFIFMFAMTSLITPPVCISTFAAASIAGTDFMRTGLRGVVLGFPSYIIPFMVVYNPTLLSIFDQGILFAVQSCFSTLMGIAAFVIGISGMFLSRLNPVQRGILIVAGCGLIWPGTLTDLVGLASFAIVFIWQKFFQKQANPTVAGPL